MACFKNGTIVELASRENISLPDFRGATLRVTSGTLWITQENDTQDIVLRAGDTWVVEKNGLTIVEAQEASTLCALGRSFDASLQLRSEKPVASSATSLWRYLQQAFAAFFGTPARSVPYA